MEDRWGGTYGFLKSARRSSFIHWHGIKTCSPKRCGKMKERLTSHQLECHPSKPSVAIESPPPDPTGITSDHTEFKVIGDLSNFAEENSNQDVGIPIRRSQCRRVVSIPLRNIAAQKLMTGTNFYKQHLQDEIIKWYLNMPGSTQNIRRDFLRHKVISNLIEKLTILSAYVDTADYHSEVIHEIDYCVDVLLMWSPGNKLQKDVSKKRLSQLLLGNIEALNEKWLYHPEQRFNTVGNFDLINFPFDDAKYIEILRDVIANWINCKLVFVSGIETCMHKNFLTDVFANRLLPILESKNNKMNILGAEIKNILEEYSPMIQLSKNATVCKTQLNTLAIDLTDKLRGIVGCCDSNEYTVCINQVHDSKNNILNDYVHKNNRKLVEEDFSEELVNVLKLTDAPEDTLSEITEVLFDSIDLVNKGNDQKVVGSIQKLLQMSGEFSEVKALTVANTLVDNVKASFNESSGKIRKPTNTLVLLTSKQELAQPFMPEQPLTSTPILPKQKKEVERLNAGEKLYTDKVAKVVESWLDTTEMTFKTNEQHFFKKTIANDIAGDVKDLVKFSQMQENMADSSYKNSLYYIIIKAIQKYGLLDGPVNPTTPQVKELKERIMDLETHEMLAPQHGNRQDLANVKAQLNNPGHDLRPDALDIVEDNISVWLNEQPSDIFKDHDRSLRNNQLHDVATKIQQQLENKKDEANVKATLKKWLQKIVKPDRKKDVNRLAEELKDKVMKLPQNETIYENAQKRARALAGEDSDLNGNQSNSQDEAIDSRQNSQSNLDTNPDEQLKEIIEKYIEHNDEVKDPLVERALGNILLQEFTKLSPIVEKEAGEDINTKKFIMELEYITEVTDWLKNIPFYSLLNSVTERVEFINDLARIIADIEEERAEGLPGPDHEIMLYDHILQYMKQLPIPPDYMPQLMVSANQLRKRISNHRPETGSLVPTNDKAIVSDKDVVKLMEEFMSNLHGEVIGDDQLLREAYIARLFKEIRKIMNAGIFSDSQFMNKLETVHLPVRESVKRFGIEMGYAAEIADWLHNFPLIPLKSVEDHENRIRIIGELAEKMVVTDIKKAANPDDAEADEDLDCYIDNWIVNLNLMPQKEIVVPVLISQLRKRMEKVQKLEGKSQLSVDPPVFFKDVIANRTRGPQEEDISTVGDVGDLMVKAIDNWCQDLPITEKSNQLTEATKENVAINIFKTVGQLNDDPHVANNDLLFEELLRGDIDVTLTNLSKNHTGIENNKEELKESLLNDVMDAKKQIKTILAGDNYKNALECTIDASFPNPVGQPPRSDPGYELYRHRMAMLWLLENYDHVNDDGTLKYRMKLNQDVDKYANQAQKRNASPIEKEEIFNEIFSSLYKQSPPGEHYIQEEIESIKTRCEVEEWSEELPLRQASGFDDLLERDQILGILAKKLFDIERSENPDYVDETMQKEILKWIKKLPLNSGEDKSLNMYVCKLICKLKASVDQRRCKREGNKKLEKGISQKKYNEIKLGIPRRKANTSQIAGPSGIKPGHEKSVPSRTKAGDLISKIIEKWCKQLPLKVNSTQEDQDIRDEAVLKLHQLLIDLHVDLNILNNEDLYEHHLNVGIQKLLSDLPTYGEEQWARNARKGQLISELSAIRSLIVDDLCREGYKQNLKSVMSSFIEETAKPNKTLMDEHAKNQIIDDFVQYNYNKNNYSEQQIYRDKIQNTIEDALKDDDDNSDLDPKLTSNRLIAEMNKVKAPRESALSDEVLEIRMRNKVSELLDELPESLQKEHTKWALARNLINIQRVGGGDDEQIKAVIGKAIEKHGVDISPEKIDAFVDTVTRNGEGSARRASLKKDSRARKMSKGLDSQKKRDISRTPQNEPMNQTVPPRYSNSPDPSNFFHNRSLPNQMAHCDAHPIPNQISPSAANPAQNAQRTNQPCPKNQAAPLRSNIGPQITLTPPQPTDNQRRQSNIDDICTYVRIRTPATAQISAQTENDSWRNSENNVRNAGTETEKRKAFCECTEHNKKNNCPGRCGKNKPLYCDECEGDNDCDYDLPLCPCDLFSRYFCYY